VINILLYIELHSQCCRRCNAFIVITSMRVWTTVNYSFSRKSRKTMFSEKSTNLSRYIRRSFRASQWILLFFLLTKMQFSTFRITNCLKKNLTFLKFGLTCSIKPPYLNKSHVFKAFERLHQDLKRHLADKSKSNEVRSEIQLLATIYVNFVQAFAKWLKKLKKNKNIIILRPDKGNGVVVLDKVVYNNAMGDL